MQTRDRKSCRKLSTSLSVTTVSVTSYDNMSVTNSYNMSITSYNDISVASCSNISRLVVSGNGQR
jgi:hypothetical protein